jgi:GT2 family glycosyltransferase
MEMDSPSDALVICTRNRIDDIKRCLASVRAASHIPGRILVVDSSDGNDTEEYCALTSMPITYIKAPRGLTIQRNIALAEINEEIVHFIDDDVEVERDYFRALNQVFRDSPHTAGAGGAIVGSRAGRPSLVSRLGLNSSLSPGRVLRSGVNTQCFDTPKAINVDWLSGCSMSFRMSVICGLKFDERRKGYAVGEDVDFGLKVLQRGPLVYTPNARLVQPTRSPPENPSIRSQSMGVSGGFSSSCQPRTRYLFEHCRGPANRGEERQARTFSAAQNGLSSFRGGCRCLKGWGECRSMRMR